MNEEQAESQRAQNSGAVEEEVEPNYITKPQHELQSLLQERPQEKTIQEWILKYKACAVQVAEIAGQV